ncbi:MAG: hypothetical protein HOM21_13645 [Halobacteriovoraceae bacterium]|jgi:endonuclease/exonuclease/phosphatase family metal-dependent hydrolase|nr:hypothetical protein [Halobacteriovoraceae bacterium]
MRKILLAALMLFSCDAFSAEFRALSYNIWGRPWPLPSKPKRFPKIKKYLSTHNVDVVGFQESFSRKAKRLKDIPGFPYYARGNAGSLLRTSSGILTISKHPIVRVERLRYSDCAGTDCLARKGALLTTHLIAGVGLVDVVNTHLNAAGGDETREAQLWQLILFINDQHVSGRPLIVMGDFNFPPTSKLYDLWIRTANIVYDTHQKYVDDNPELPQSVRQGWTKPKKKNGKPGKRIDYIFSGLDSTHLKTITSKVMFSNHHNGRALSDHFAVEAIFSTED